MPISVLLAENREKLRRNLRRSLSSFSDVTIVGEAGDAEQALRLANTSAPDVIIMDVKLPDMNGAAVARRLLQCHPDSKIIAYSTFAYDSLIDEMKKAGASGFILKDCSDDALCRLIRDVVQDKKGFRILVAENSATAPLKGASSEN